MQKIKIPSLAVIAILALSIFIIKTKTAQAVEFNPNYILSDEEMLDSRSLDQKGIQAFLESKGSFLATYSCPNFEGTTKTAAEIIYDAAANNYDCDGVALSDKPTQAERAIKCKKIFINPKFLLVLLQKEQSLIEDDVPTEYQLNWALGYGCFDGRSCNPYWKGFGKQLNSAALQFYDYMANPQWYTYKVNQTYTVTNTGRESSVIIPANRATAGLYNYTPHVYNGNFNFFKLWQRYFTRIYPDGTLLRAKGEGGVWLIQNAQRRAFSSKGALTSRYDINKIVSVNKSDLANYPIGDPIKFPQYSLVRVPTGGIYLLVDDKRRPFINMKAFRNVGLNPEEIIKATVDDIKGYADGEPITATTSYPTGALLQNKKTGGVYWVANDTKAPVLDKIFLKTKFRFKPIHPMDPKKLDKYATIKPVFFDDGELLKAASSPAVYVIANGRKKPFVSGKVFEDMGYKWTNVITIPAKILNLYPDDLPVTGITEITIIDAPVASTTSAVINQASSTPTTASSTTIASSTITASTTASTTK